MASLSNLDRPLVPEPPVAVAPPTLSVRIPTYRPGIFLRDTIVSVQASLAVAGVAHDLEIVDDASPDVDVAALVAAWAATGEIQPVAVFRRAANGGLAACWNTCIERASGTWVHILHQDDRILPPFYRAVLDVAEAHPEAGMVFCRSRFLRGDALEDDVLEQPATGLLGAEWLARICAGQRLQCPSVLVRGEAYRRLGGFDGSLAYVIDWEMWIRIAASYPVGYVHQALAVYRVHEQSETGRIKARGDVAIDAVRCLRVVRRTLERAGRTDCLPAACRYAITISGYAAYEAELRSAWFVSARERGTALRAFRAFFAPDERRAQLRLVLRALAKGVLGRLVPRAPRTL